MLGGQLLYILLTQIHVGGHANDHSSIFVDYAGSGSWTLVHLGQFLSMAILLAGMIVFHVVLEGADSRTRLITRLGALSAAIAIALYGVLQAVDGVALKHSITAWVNAPVKVKDARFAAAETVRWLEWGTRSYHDFAFSLALILFASAALMARTLPKFLAFLIALSALDFALQGWISGTSGFTTLHSAAIVVGWSLNLAWMIWLAIHATRSSYSGHAKGPREIPTVSTGC